MKFFLPFLYTIFLSTFLFSSETQFKLSETLPVLDKNSAPQSWNDAWFGFDPRNEPLEVEVLKEWEEDGIVLKVIRYRIGIFKRKRAIF